MSGRQKNQYYAYLVPMGGGAKAKSGVVASWTECERLVSGKPGARFKGFPSREEAGAWLDAGAAYEVRPSKEARRSVLVPGIYFDAGTGRGEGVEVSVTDEKGYDLLHKAISKSELNRFGKHLVGNGDATNNYGELLALRYALEIAEREGVKKIFGDSKLVIEYWSQWRIKRKEVAPETVRLAEEVSAMREELEARGGTVARIPGDDNPADLGFHR